MEALFLDKMRIPTKFKCCVGQLGYSRKMRWRSDIPLVLKRKKKECTKGKNNL